MLVVAGRAPPVDALRRIAGLIAAELPERLAGTRAAAAMRAVSDGVCDPLRLDEERRDARRQAVGFGFLARKWLKRFLSRDGQAQITPTARQAARPSGSCRSLRHARHPISQ